MIKSINEMIEAKQIAAMEKASEGSVRPGPYYLPVSGGWLSAEAGSSWNWWQLGYDLDRAGRSAMIEACISAYSQTCASLPADHWLANAKGGRDRITTSSLSRILKQGPNSYQTLSDFVLNAVDDLYSDGNAYAIAVRNSRQEITELHLMNPIYSRPQIAADGSVFYSLGGNYIVEKFFEYPLLVPERDVLHLKLRTNDYNMLLGVSPIISAANEIAAGNAMMQQQLGYYLNQARPSMVLVTDLPLSAEQMQALRDRWDEQSRGMNAGRTPILSHGIKPNPIAINPVDSQLAEILNMTDEHIALAFRVPLPILGKGATTAASAEDLMSSWLATSLGFCLNHIETSLDALFGLRGYPDEYTEFDTSALLRSSMKTRVEAFARGVQTGIYAPNEARADFGLAKVPFGDEPRVQQQVVPLSAAEGIPAPSPAPRPQAAPPAPKDFANVERQLRSRFRASHSQHLAL